MTTQGTAKRPGFGRPSREASKLKSVHVLSVARDLFAENGYRSVSMRQVADVAQISTRTLYNHYPDKLSLFNACLDFGPKSMPRLAHAKGGDLFDELCGFSLDVVHKLSTNASLRLALLVLREGLEFPELLLLGEANQRRYLLAPLERYLKEVGLASEDNCQLVAKGFLSLALSDWQRRRWYGHPPATETEMTSYIRFAVALFLKGATGLAEEAAG